MNRKILLALFLVAATLVAGACSAKIETATTNSNAKKTDPAKATDAKKAEALKNEKKPDGPSKGVPEAKKVPTPADWIEMVDEVKGYGFKLPDGSTGGSETSDGVDVFVATTPAPSEVVVMVLAYKDKTKSKEDLLDDAERVINDLGDKITHGKLTEINDDYSIAEATSVDKDGKKSRMIILVGTDVTDNYIMIVGTDESKFDANKKIIDEIWSSFEMFSGGASGRS
jgi:hypothetical protein